MIKQVIVCGLRRAGYLVPEMEIRQMIGRAGRSYDKDAVGNVVLLSSNEDSDTAENYLYGDMPAILSKMENIENLAFHMLPSIYGGGIYDDVTAYEWYRRSLAHFQKKKFQFKTVFNYLISHEMISGEEESFKITELGKLSCKFYFPPSSIFVWKEKMEKIALKNYWSDDYVVSWALSTNELGINVNAELMELIEMNSSFGFQYNEKEQVALYYCLLAGHKPKELKFAIAEHRKDIDRVLNVLLSLDKIYSLGIKKEIEILSVRIKERMDYDMAKLAIELDIHNKTLLSKLKEFGLNSFEDIKDNIDKLRQYGDAKMMEQIEEALGEFI